MATQKEMAKVKTPVKYFLTKEQFEVLKKNDLIVPVNPGKEGKKGIDAIIEMAKYRATRNGSASLLAELEGIENRRDNLVFCSYEFDQNQPLLVEVSEDCEWTNIRRGFIDLGSMHGTVLDIGQRIVVSDEGKEYGFSFQKGEVVAESEDAAKNWGFGKVFVLDSGKVIKKPVIVIDENAGKEKTKKKKEMNVGGQLMFDFEKMEAERQQDEAESIIKTPEGSERMKVVKAKKFVSDSEYVFEIDVTFYSKMFRKSVPVVDKNGLAVRDDDGEILMKEVVKAYPYLDVEVRAYENAIDYSMRYALNAADLVVLSSIQIDDVCLVDVASKNEEGVFLHTLTPEMEKEDIDYEKEEILTLYVDENGHRVKKGDLKNVVSFSDVLRFKERLKRKNA